MFLPNRFTLAYVNDVASREEKNGDNDVLFLDNGQVLVITRELITLYPNKDSWQALQPYWKCGSKTITR